MSISEGHGINSDGEVFEERDCPTSDDDVTVKWFGRSLLEAGRKATPMGTFGLYFTWDIPEEKLYPQRPRGPEAQRSDGKGACAGRGLRPPHSVQGGGWGSEDEPRPNGGAPDGGFSCGA